MSALLDSLAAGCDGDASRRALLDALLQDGLPPARAEAWKYTSLRQLERRSFGTPQPQAIDPTLLTAIPAPRIVFVNGQFDADLSLLSETPAGLDLQSLSQLLHGDDTRALDFLERRYLRVDEPFARLNAALAREGMVLRVEAGTHIEQPLHLVNIGTPDSGDVAWHLRHFIELREGASLALVEHELAGGDHAHLGNHLLHAHVAAGGHLSHTRIQSAAPRATLFARTDAALATTASYQRSDFELGAQLSRHELNVRLDGEGAALRADGVLLANGRRHLDTRLGIDHAAGDSRCELLWRGLASQRGRVVFHGGILIREGADGSDANLSNKNLLLSEHAEIDSQPILEIHADDVKAAHGAAVGQLDPTALFYLRSRGLPEAQARALLTGAFCREVLGRIDNASVRALCETALDSALEQVTA